MNRISEILKFNRKNPSLIKRTNFLFNSKLNFQTSTLSFWIGVKKEQYSQFSPKFTVIASFLYGRRSSQSVYRMVRKTISFSFQALDSLLTSPPPSDRESPATPLVICFSECCSRDCSSPMTTLFLLNLWGQSAIKWSSDLQWWHRLGIGPNLHFAATWFPYSPQL